MKIEGGSSAASALFESIGVKPKIEWTLTGAHQDAIKEQLVQLAGSAPDKAALVITRLDEMFKEGSIIFEDGLWGENNLLDMIEPAVDILKKSLSADAASQLPDTSYRSK